MQPPTPTRANSVRTLTNLVYEAVSILLAVTVSASMALLGLAILGWL